MPKVDPKTTSEPPMVVPADWDRCHVYLPNKHRFCRQERYKGSIYCGNHQHLLVVQETKSYSRKRIRCPIDPSHYIFEDNLEKHCAICPLAVKRRKLAEQPYYDENINAGGYGDIHGDGVSVNDTGRKGEQSDLKQAAITTLTLEDAQDLALRVLEVHQLIFRRLETGNQTKSTRDTTCDDLHSALSMEDLSEPEIKAGIAEAFQIHRAKSGGPKHVTQLASLVGHIRKLEVLPHDPLTVPAKKGRTSNSVTFLEMGAGRGMLGLTAAGVAAASGIPTELIMVERTGARSKADKVFRTSNDKGEDGTYLKLDTVKWSRIESDLAHVSLPKILDKSQGTDGTKNDVVIIAKHLCGAGTDLALKSMESIPGRVHSCLMATCCHGLCDWKLYVGRDALRTAMATENFQFSPEHFELMRQWCAASVAGQTKKSEDGQQTESVDADGGGLVIDDDDEAEHPVSTTEEEVEASSNRVNVGAVVSSLQLRCGVEGLGRACQRLIDYGRMQYLSKVIFNRSSDLSGLCHYVPPEISPQNACLIGRKGNDES